MKDTQSRPTPYNSHVKTTTSIPIISRRVVPLHWIHNTSQSPAHHVTYSRLRDDHLSNLVVKLLGHLFKRTATPTENVKMANVRKTKQMSKNQRGVLRFSSLKLLVTVGLLFLVMRFPYYCSSSPLSTCFTRCRRNGGTGKGGGAMPNRSDVDRKRPFLHFLLGRQSSIHFNNNLFTSTRYRR